jgi:type II secretory pathway pseudopilin PulG
MMNSAPTRRRRPPPAHPSEAGFTLLAVIFLVALLTIALAIALPRVTKQIQRDREIETMHRGKQYARAVKLYYKKFGAYPPNVDAMVKTNNIRFLRKKYTDPMTGVDDWKPVLFGQNKAPTAMGFFGQPLTGSTAAGIGPSGGNGVAGASTAGSSSFFGSSSSGASSSGASSSFGASADSSAAAAANATDSTGGSGSSDSSGNGSSDSSSASNGGSNASTTSGSISGGSIGSNSSTGLTGQTFGGAGIIGFSPGSPKQSILLYKKKNHYNEWEFVYDPLADQVTISGNTGSIGQPASSTSTPIGTSASTTTGTSGTSSTTTTQQQ